jgi:hypothetical protein
MLVHLRYQNSCGLCDDRLKICDCPLGKNVCHHLSFHLMFSLDPYICQMAVFASATIIPNIFEEVCAMTINIGDGLWIRDRNVIWGDTNMSAEFLVGLVNGEIMRTFPVVAYSPQR